MSELEYRKGLQGLIATYYAAPQLQSFLRAMLESEIPIVDQLHKILLIEDVKRKDVKTVGYVITIARDLKISSLAPALIDMFERLKDEALKRQIMYMLGNLDHDQARHFLLTTLQTHEDRWLRVAAAASLEIGNHPEAVALLLELVQNTAEDVELRARAIETLAYQGDKSLVPYLLPFLKDSESEIQQNALYAVGRLGDASFTPYIKSVLENAEQIEDIEIASMANYILDTWARKST